jgi:citrate lyase subunit beta/citryl-CoA lyase
LQFGPSLAGRASAPTVELLAKIPLEFRKSVDVEAAAAAGADGLLITKAAGPEHIVLLADMLDELERGLGCTRAMVLVPMIETAAAVTAMAAITAASPRVVGLLMGAEDLASECGCAADDELMVMLKRQLVLAAVAADIGRSERSAAWLTSVIQRRCARSH